MQLYTSTEIIKERDEMSTDELRKITNKVKAKFGYVSFRLIFLAMGYTHRFNDFYSRD